MRRLYLKVIFTLVLGTQFYASNTNASIMNTPVPTNAYITLGAFDWAWAGPCAPFNPSCATIDLSYQSAFGWRLPTVAEIDAAVAAAGGAVGWSSQFLFPGANLTGQGPGGADFACATAYFNNTYTHCDYDDAASGYIYNLSGAPSSDPAEETFVLRSAEPPPVETPAPATLLLFGVGLAMMKANRRKGRVK